MTTMLKCAVCPEATYRKPQGDGDVTLPGSRLAKEGEIFLLLEKTLATFFVGTGEKLQEVLKAFKSLLPLDLQDLQPKFVSES